MLPPKDYYDYMYDIEDLTGLNTKAEPKRDTVVCAAEELIRTQQCSEAVRILRTAKEGESLAQTLISALWTKDRLFQGAVESTTDKSPKACALEELCEYIQRDLIEVEQEMLVELPVEKDWRRLKIHADDPQDILRFYQQTDSYIFELMAANNIVQTLFTYAVMAERLLRLGVHTILDYGGGAGSLSILLARLGYHVTYADVASKTADFAKWRFEKRRLQIPMITLAGDEGSDLFSKDFEDYNFDCILSTEVIEHVPQPLSLIKAFAEKLPEGGVAVVSESCEYTEQFISHLESNKQYGGEAFISHMKDVGLHALEYDLFIPQQIFLKGRP